MSVVIVTSSVSAAATKTSSTTFTFGFGGKVIATQIPGVVCTGTGTLAILSSNIQGAVDATTSQFSKSTGQKVVGGVTGVYKMIPFYATNLQKKPKIGGWILGKANVAVDTSICKTTSEPPIPIPVRKASNYAVSGGTTSSQPGASQSGTKGYSTNTTNGTINYE